MIDSSELAERVLGVFPNEAFLQSPAERSKKALLAKMMQASGATALFDSDRSKNSLLVQTVQPLSKHRKEAQPVRICILAAPLLGQQ